MEVTSLRHDLLLTQSPVPLTIPSDCGLGAGDTEQQAQQVQCCRERWPLPLGAAGAELFVAANPAPCQDWAARILS